jgi:hypothetical protein
MREGFCFAEVAEAPTGVMCIKRDVLHQMMKRYRELNYAPRIRKPTCHWLIPFSPLAGRRWHAKHDG